MAYALNSAKANNGEVVVRNDHIYVSPPWSARDGTPYMIARIIEFLPPNAAHKKGMRSTQTAAALAQANEVHVRVSLYYRPSDISGRQQSDFRLLLAAIHTDVQPVSNIRGKCYVRHKDRIEDLLAWKKRPDHFYFARFYDPYIKREFEVIRTESVNNIPQDVKEALMSRYEFLITEREMIADLIDTYKTCCVCEQWASTQEAVKCEACKLHYHMRCLNPPLLAKPAKGYSWVCPPCSAKRHQDVQENRYLFGGSSAPKEKAKALQKKEKNATSNRADIMYRGWPWRYFGQFTSARDTLDPDDLIFPRAATRVGQKFQATVPTWEVQQAAEAAHRAHQFVEGEAGPSRHIPVERGHDIGERKNESTYDVWCVPSLGLDAYLEDVRQLKLPVPPYDVERLNHAVHLYTSRGRDKAFSMMRKSRLDDFHPIIFTDKEVALFEAELDHQGGLDAHETGRQLKRASSDVLRFSYQWKNKRLKIENDALKAHHKVNSAHARQNRTLGAPSLGRIRAGAKADSEDEDDEVSIYGADYVRDNKMQCAACSTRLGENWWRCPRTLPGFAMCEPCGSNYRKYGVISSVKAEDSKRPEKKDAVANKKGKGDLSSASTPAPPPAPRLPPCACCKRMEPKSTMARCKNCTFSVHSGCYGIASQDMGPAWLCELCHNVEEQDNHLEPRCLLCPKDNAIAVAKIKSKRAPSDFDMLSALKPTEGRQWAHVLCTAWIPEIIYTYPSKMKAVEGITNLPRERWSTACTLCDQLDGAVIQCTDCVVSFHASCAWLLGYKFGFEFTLAKPGKREQVTIAKFKEEEGVMNPGCWCKGHDLEGRRIYDAHEIDPEQNETALQIYTSAYKTLPAHDETFALLRKAMRMDAITVLSAGASPAIATNIVEGNGHGDGVPQSRPIIVTSTCTTCGTDVSPRWYDSAGFVVKAEHGRTNGVARERLCHMCHFDKEAEASDGQMDVD